LVSLYLAICFTKSKSLIVESENGILNRAHGQTQHGLDEAVEYLIDKSANAILKKVHSQT